ncbi:uncharacterized protein LOC110970241 [Acanthochromis polyacanthus]|uniref:uncharacterized protein LOC110970241 n=1 Tax=Acanthochromis polyacanthus TaxID=80966 RepID=UPI000B909EBA|nr:uncharacterized protein LOC110970241 [Acanthochromis polyacanthus]XP_022076187.1 uncharacterized protein LOC110970241 [Acanthochromis polyacanthus]
MSFTTNPAPVPDRDSLPLKKRDQRPSSPLQQQQQHQQCDAANFKAPYPYKSQGEFKTKHMGPFQPVPRRVPALYQPWMQTHTSARSKPHVLSAFREHHGWAEWGEFNSLHPGWDHHFQHQSHPSADHPGHSHSASRFSAVSLVSEGFHRGSGGYGWEKLKTLRDNNLNPERLSYGRHKGPYVRRGDRKTEYFPRVEKASPPSLSTCLPHSQHDDLSTKATKHSFSGVSPDSSNSTCIPMKEDTSRFSAAASAASSSSTSSNRFPWLLPHFVAGSLIELRDGRLRRVEHLQTEDFLLGSLACPDLRLSCCTVQSISPSASSSSISRLLILLHDQQSQELVDVYVEYPFFVRGRGWSSCSPQRTARLCGLQCRQLSVGDVCLALTPVSPPQPPSAALEPRTSPNKSKGGCEPLKAPQTASHPPVTPKQQTGEQKMGAEAVRRRHYSAPELRGPGTNCM